ncbi:uncharacterized protein [Nothobranchius furzeri]|uniref:Glycosyltransferase family 92 protein n=1 Tax=Nothobranchius furzeri TaxID=105023 RepID=A0A8C6VUQ3_NOTFU|nr:putative LOC107392050-like protein [Nothobranchius furzeri]
MGRSVCSSRKTSKVQTLSGHLLRALNGGSPHPCIADFLLGFHFFSAQMEKANHYKRTLLLIILITCVFIIFHLRSPRSNGFIPKRRGPRYVCKPLITEQTITPLKNTKHLLVSAFMDQRVKGFDVRIIGMFLRDSIQPLYCLFCCSGHLNGTKPAMVLPHTDHFGFPFGATDVMCQLPKNCDVSHVTLLTRPSTRDVSDLSWIPVKNKKTRGKDELTENFTVCISTLFGKYNNVLQFAQSLEMYRLLGVNRVVIYNNSCGPDLEHLLQSYVQEGFVEMVPWPIDKHMNPSHGWQRSQSEGDIHYFGQLTTLNECIYRSMNRSRYVLLNDIDEIIMPYMHNNLMSLMDRLQPLHPDVGVFLIENHVFPKKYFDPSGKFHLPQWRGVPGINILEHIYREDPDRDIYHPYKMIVQPRMVEQTSVHEALKYFGKTYRVPLEVCRLIHVRVALRRSLTLEQLNVDKRLWDFQEKLISNVDRVLGKLGFLTIKN